MADGRPWCTPKRVRGWCGWCGRVQLGPPQTVRNFVFTADNLPALYLLRLLVSTRSNAVLMGPTGERGAAARA